jgi:hypothetical protein
MLIASRAHTAGNSTRYEVDYSQWLDEGRTLLNSAFTAAMINDALGNAPPSDVTIANVSVTSTHLYFFVEGGSLNENFTVQVQVKDTLNEIVIDTINFNVIAP